MKLQIRRKMREIMVREAGSQVQPHEVDGGTLSYLFCESLSFKSVDAHFYLIAFCIS